MTSTNTTGGPETTPSARVWIDSFPGFPLGLLRRDLEIVATLAFGRSEVVGWWRQRSRMSDRRRREALSAIVAIPYHPSPRLLGRAPDRGEPDHRVDGPAAAEPEALVEG